MIKLEGYQRLEQDFFRLCQSRNIKYSPMLVLIYLRGLYCKFGKPNFYCPDKNIMKDLGLSSKSLQRIRQRLQERGVIEFKVFQGRGKATEYLILKTELAPELKPVKLSALGGQNVHFSTKNLSTKTSQIVHSKVIYSKEQSKGNCIPIDRKKMHQEAQDLLRTLNK